MNIRSTVASAWAVCCLLGSPAMGVIVGGAGGDATGNATESGLQSHLVSASLPAFPFWNNLLRVSDSSGVYLGRNATTGEGWVMTATHVTPLVVGTDTITVAGQAYIVRDNRIIKHPDDAGTQITDIRLYAIGGQLGDPAPPALPAVPVLTSDVVDGDDLILTGRSRRQQSPTEDTTAPYEWDWDSSPANHLTRQMRWGSNHVEIWSEAAPDTLFLLGEGPSKTTACFACIFDDPAGSGTAHEGQLALFDSGGGAFVKRDGVWYLAGTNYAVEDGPDGDAVASPAGYGDVSLITHLASYRDQIETITGPLTPASSLPLADLDGDGVSNLLEYAMNLNPLVNDFQFVAPVTGLLGLPLVRLENISGNNRLTIEFVRRTPASGAGLTYIPEFSPNLVDWEQVGTETVVSISPGWDRVKIVDSLTTNDAAKRFARVRVAAED